MEQYVFSEERCVMCGAVIPEGRQVCRDCERGVLEKEQAAREQRKQPKSLRSLLRRLLGDKPKEKRGSYGI